jgi:DNA invertase Pin-like site-specific DNA recombinase
MATYGYVRVSTDEQQAGLSAQLAAIREHSKASGLGEIPEDHIYSDPAICREQSPLERPGFSELFGRLKKGDCVLVARWDRLGVFLEVGLLVRDLAKKGIAVISANGGDAMGDPSAELLMNMQLVISQYELRLLRQRTSQALRAKRAKGEVHCRRFFGFQAIDGKWVPDEQEQRIGRWVAQEVAKGIPILRVAQALNEKGIPSPSGSGKWRNGTVERVAKRFAEKVA